MAWTFDFMTITRFQEPRSRFYQSDKSSWNNIADTLLSVHQNFFMFIASNIFSVSFEILVLNENTGNQYFQGKVKYISLMTLLKVYVYTKDR